VSLKVRCNAKLNLFLKVYGVRPDGFHNLISVMQSVDLADVLEIEETNSGAIEIDCNMPEVPTDETNLVHRAAAKLAEETGHEISGLKFRISKNIPVGSGLAGGSADCAGTLVGLNRLWDLKLPEKKLIEIGASLGSDVPFCLIGGTMLVSGRGEVLEPLPQGIADVMGGEGAFLLVLPGIKVDTKTAYGLLDDERNEAPGDPGSMAEDLEAAREGWILVISQENFPMLFHNDFEKPVYKNWEDLDRIFKNFRNHTGHALLSGSGSCIFSWFPAYMMALEADRNYIPVGYESVVVARPAPHGLEIIS
jgi:4-diphosphocytidyl-2-C-methyl-D-erythritol kinase